MNSSLICLRIASIKSISPLFSLGGKLLLKDSSISRLFSTAIYSSERIVCAGDRFSSMLQTAVVIHSCFNGDSFYAQSVPNSTCSCFFNCIFSNITITTAQGACIYCSSSSITISVNSSVFQFCVSSGSPSSGGVYVVGPLYMKRCCFNQVYRTYNGDSAYTNTIYSIGTPFWVESTTFFCSGLTNNGAGDSTYYTYGGCVYNANLNATQCYGFTGGACGSFYYSLSGSVSLYTTVINCGQWSSQELQGTAIINPSDANVVNNTNFYCCYFHINGAITSTITRFIFSGNNASQAAFALSSNAVLTCIDCVSDVSAISLTYKASPELGVFTHFFGRPCKFITNQFSDSTMSQGKSFNLFIFGVLLSIHE